MWYVCSPFISPLLQGLYLCAGDEPHFTALDTDGDGRIGWPAFKRWWDRKGRHLDLSPERKRALDRAKAYFRVRAYAPLLACLLGRRRPAAAASPHCYRGLPG